MVTCAENPLPDSGRVPGRKLVPGLVRCLRGVAPVLFTILVACGAGNSAPEGFSQIEWKNEQQLQPAVVQAHVWINQVSARREQRGLAVEACYRAFAFSHGRIDSEELLMDLPRRKRYYRQINTSWMLEVAQKAQRGEGSFGELLARQLETLAQHCWNPKAAEALRSRAQKIRSL